MQFAQSQTEDLDDEDLYEDEIVEEDYNNSNEEDYYYDELIYENDYEEETYEEPYEDEIVYYEDEIVEENYYDEIIEDYYDEVVDEDYEEDYYDEIVEEDYYDDIIYDNEEEDYYDEIVEDDNEEEYYDEIVEDEELETSNEGTSSLFNPVSFVQAQQTQKKENETQGSSLINPLSALDIKPNNNSSSPVDSTNQSLGVNLKRNEDLGTSSEKGSSLNKEAPHRANTKTKEDETADFLTGVAQKVVDIFNK